MKKDLYKILISAACFLAALFCPAPLSYLFYAASYLLVGAGVIGRNIVMAMMEAVPSLEEIHLIDLDITKAEGIAKEAAEELKKKLEEAGAVIEIK